MEKIEEKNNLQLPLKSKNNIYLFEEACNKIKSIKKDFRCKSANNNKKLSFNLNIKNNLNNKYFDFNRNKKLDNAYNIKLISAKTRNKLNSNVKSINISKIFESKLKIDSTKQSTRRTRINSSFSFLKMNNSSQNEKKISFKNNNIKEYGFQNNKIFLKKNDSTKKLIFKKMKNNLNKYKSGNSKCKFSEINSNLNSYNNYERKKLINEDSKNSDINKEKNYPIKYSFLEHTMNNIFHTVNFINIENKKELNQNILIDIKNEGDICYEDFRIVGQELTPEELYKINQNKKHKLMKLKYEQLKQSYILENIEQIKKNNLLRTKGKKDYIPEYKLKFRNENWNNFNYESIYKYKPINFSVTTKKKTSKLKNIFFNFNLKKLKKNKSEFLYPKLSKNLEKINKSKNKRESTIIENKEKKSEQNYENILLNDTKGTKINEKANEILNNKNNHQEDKNVTNDIEENNNESKNKIEMDNNIIDINLDNKSFDIKSNSSENENIKKDYNKDNQIEKADYIFIKESENYLVEILDFFDYMPKVISKNKYKYKKRNSFNYSDSNEIRLSIINKNKKIASKKISDEKNKQKREAWKNQSFIPISKYSNYKNKIFKQKEENKNNINKSKKNIIEKNIKLNIGGKTKEKNISNNDKNKEYYKKFEEYKKQKEKKASDSLYQEKLNRQIDKSHSNEKKSYKPFYQILKEMNQEVNKIELNYISLRPNKYINYINAMRKQKRQILITKKYPKSALINKLTRDEKYYNNSEEKSDESIKDLEERLSYIKNRKHNKKSSLLEKINQKYKETEESKDNIREKFLEKFNKIKLFKSKDFDIVKDIENNLAMSLLKLREDIKFKISVGECEKTEMDEYIKFENRLNKYKKECNLNDKNKRKENSYFLLKKINEFIELFEIRENKKMEENRINKFLNNLNYDLHYNIPWSLTVKGRRCSSKNFNPNLSSLSEIKK